MPGDAMFDDGGKKKPPQGITPLRVTLWVLGGVIGLYLIISGLVQGLS
jgi:hypothetical protein